QNADECSVWSNCAAGQYVSSAPSATSDRECTDCGGSAYSSAPNAGSCTAWTDCQLGFYVSQAGSFTQDRECTACPDGETSYAINASICSALPAKQLRRPFTKQLLRRRRQ